MPAMEETQSLGRYIRQSRLDRGMSLGQLAEEIGRSSSSVRRWERDEVAPAHSVMPVLAEVLHVDISELEVRRPGAVGDEQDGAPIDESATGSSTIEQHAVASGPPVMPEDPTNAPSRLGLFGDMWASIFEGKDNWIGWVRGVATAVVVVILLVVFVWAVGELFAALREVWNSLEPGG